MVRLAKAEDGILRLLVESTQTNAAAVQVHSAEAAETTYRPTLEVEYSPAGGNYELDMWTIEMHRRRRRVPLT
jgi:hypothetical protein